jgi:hypothetical protein
MLEPHIVKHLLKLREQPDPVPIEVALVSVKKIVLADCKMGLVFRRDVNPPDAYGVYTFSYFFFHFVDIS